MPAISSNISIAGRNSSTVRHWKDSSRNDGMSTPGNASWNERNIARISSTSLHLLLAFLRARLETTARMLGIELDSPFTQALMAAL